MKNIIFYVSLCVFIALFISSCSPSSYMLSTPPLQNSQPNSIIEQLNTQAGTIQTLKAAGTLTIIDTINTPRTYRIIVMFSQPDYCLIRAYKPLIPVQFQAITAQGMFHIFIPNDNMVFTGTNEALQLTRNFDSLLNPVAILYALFPRAIQPQQTTNISLANQEYLISVLSTQKTLMRNIWIESISQHVLKERYYSQGGLQIFEITRTHFVTDSKTGIPLARTITIHHSINKITVDLRFEKIVLNEPINKGIFDFCYPEGVIIEDVE